MKSAFVLGLALAVNAQVDNELATSLPYNPSGADLVKFAKQSQQTVYRPTAHVVRDDEVDDELHLSGADLVKYAKESQQTVYRPTAHVVRRDDEVDDELHLSGADLVKYAKQSQQTVYRPTAHVVRRDDETPEDELMVFYTKDSRGVHHYAGASNTYPVRRDDEVDDELHLSGADLVKYAKESQQTVYRPTAHVVRRDDEAPEDELMVFYTKDSRGVKHYTGASTTYPTRRDDEELYLSGADLVKYAKQSQQTVYRPTAHVVRDDELHLSGADLVKYAKQSQQTVYRPTAHVVRDDETPEDELMVFYTKDSRGVHHYAGASNTYPVRRDDEVDDELAYLGHLIKETQTEKKPEIRRNFRHVEKN